MPTHDELCLLCCHLSCWSYNHCSWTNHHLFHLKIPTLEKLCHPKALLSTGQTRGNDYFIQTEISAIFPCVYSIGYVVNLIIYQQKPTYDLLYSVIMAAISALISIIFLIFGHSIIQRKVKIHSTDISSIHINLEVTYKDLNPTSFMTNDFDSSA